MIHKSKEIINVNNKKISKLLIRKNNMKFKISNSSNGLFKYDPLAVNLVRNRSLVNDSVYEIKNLVHNKNENAHNSPATKEWTNSVYTYNKNYSKPLPATLNMANRLLRGYLNLSPLINGKKSNVNSILDKKLTLNRVFVSKAEVKYTNDKINLTVHVYNRKKETLMKKLIDILLKLKTNRNSILLKSASNLYVRNESKLLEKNNNNTYIKSMSNMKTLLNNKILTLKTEIFKTIRDKNAKDETSFSHVSLNEKDFLNDDFVNKSFKNLEEKIVLKCLNKLSNKHILYIYYTRALILNNNIFKNWFMLGLIKSLTELYNKKIELNIVNQKYFYFNSDIFLKAISTRVRDRNNRILRELSNAFNTILLPIFNYFLKNKGVNAKSKGVSAYLKNDIFNSIKYKHISGVRVEAAGRLTKRLTASRALSEVKILGCLTNFDEKFNNKRTLTFRGCIKPNLQYTIAHSKTRNGAFGLKGWVNSK